ncbi:MAG: hypothetical protein ACOVRN_10280 [Flavobacterium sp.]
MSNKTISINPSLFSVGASKTRKQRDKKSKANVVPLISPNVLKNKLLKRIKEHKQKETEHLENNKRRLTPHILPEPQKKQDIEFTDEFTDSIEYLQTLSKQKKVEETRQQQELAKQKQREELERRTIRNHHAMVTDPLPTVHMDLPEELLQFPAPNIIEPLSIKVNDDVPYGVLKGGTKPSYREWSKTQKNLVVTNPQASLVIDTPQKTARENRLQMLKQKIKSKTEPTVTMSSVETDILIRKPMPTVATTNITPNTTTNDMLTNVSSPKVNTGGEEVNTGGGRLVGTKHITKKTIKRKYTLGRSKIKKTVSVLIKDRGTRKKILNAQKDLKRRNINDIKAYLRDHNLIKTGSNAPSDVLRKLYESAMLTGEITNSNPATLLHNLSKEDKQI